MPAAQLPAPSAGWNTFDPVVGMDPMAPGVPSYALVLDNLLPEEGALRVRPGYREWATALPGRVDGLMAWRSGAASRLFAASGAGIYRRDGGGAGWSARRVRADIGDLGRAAGVGGRRTVPAGVQRDRPGADLRRHGMGRLDRHRLTGPPGWAGVFKGQPYAGRPDRLSFWYGAPGAIGGAFTEFPLQGVAKRGGGVCGMADWTLDGGQGPDDYAVFVTTEGELLVYRGTNPSSPSTWSLVGTFTMPRPVGRRFIRQFGGDVLLLTEGGVFSLRVLLSGVDEGAVARKAYTRLIEPSFLALSRGRGAQQGWDLVPLPSFGLWLVNVPWGTQDAQQVTFRAASGAAARMVGLPAACWLEDGRAGLFRQRPGRPRAALGRRRVGRRRGDHVGGRPRLLGLWVGGVTEAIHPGGAGDVRGDGRGDRGGPRAGLASPGRGGGDGGAWGAARAADAARRLAGVGRRALEPRPLGLRGEQRGAGLARGPGHRPVRRRAPARLLDAYAAGVAGHRRRLGTRGAAAMTDAGHGTRRLLLDPAHSAELAAWAAARIEHVGAAGFGECWAIGVAARGSLLAVAVLHDWQPGCGTVQLSPGLVLGPVGIARSGRGDPQRRLRPGGRRRSEGLDGDALDGGADGSVERGAGLQARGGAAAPLRAGVHAVVCGLLRHEWQGRYTPMEG